MEDQKPNDYIIGLLLGLVFLTKQNIGVYLCIPTLFIKDIRRMFKRGIGFLIPNLIILLYLLITDSVYEFIDYAFLGMGLFVKENITYNIPSIIIFTISTIYLVYKYIKTKDLKIIYLFSFQLLLFPLTDSYHLMIAIMPTIGYLINKVKLPKYIVLVGCLSYLIVSFSIHITYIYKDVYQYPNETQVYKYRKISHDIIQGVTYVSNYIKDVEQELYIISRNAYLIKLEANLPINKYDLLNNGNLGSGGTTKVINEIDENCLNKQCIFLINYESTTDSPNENDEYAKEITEHIINNYQPGNPLYSFIIYKNY
jgi:hypothetical protein